jgi:hypothetical protein
MAQKQTPDEQLHELIQEMQHGLAKLVAQLGSLAAQMGCREHESETRREEDRLQGRTQELIAETRALGPDTRPFSQEAHDELRAHLGRTIVIFKPFATVAKRKGTPFAGT